MPPPPTLLLLLLLLLQLCVTEAQQTVLISGAVQPTSIAWSDAGRVYVAEKRGIVKAAATWGAATWDLGVVLNISERVATYFDSGLLAIDVAADASGATFLYATYMLQAAPLYDSCSDSGLPAGRPPTAIAGCPTTGRLSRWPLAADGSVAGAEQVLLGDSLTAVCAQFGLANIGYVLASGDSLLLGVGAGENKRGQPDWGQFGGDPCGSHGAFRAQTAVASGAPDGPLGGKVLRLNLTSRALTVVAAGLRSPWRFAPAAGGSLAIADTGAGVFEEINTVAAAASAPLNFGFPCFDGAGDFAVYQASNGSLCTSLAPAANVTGPTFAYSRASMGAATVSISALAYNPASGLLYFGDYSTMKMYTVAADGSALAVVATGVFPSDAGYAPAPVNAIVFVDVVRGTVATLPSPTPAPTPTPTPSPVVSPPATASGAGSASAAAAAAAAAALVALLLARG